jgi:diguanylate cyclase (GGDEF)-like protein/PAS domain S-box-containing protein
VVVNYRDITDRKKAEEALRESERRYRTLAETVTDLIWTLDAKTLRFVYVSPSVQTMLGYSVEEAINSPLDKVLTPASFDYAMRSLAEALASGEEEQDNLVRSRPLELEHCRKDGSTIWAEVTTSFLRDRDGRLVEIMGVTRDITERRLRMEKLRAISLVDELTGLHNRRGFLTLSQQQLKVAYRTRRTMAVLFIDFDNLKLINDALGHEEGNLALKEVAEILKDTFRESDIIARIGGDEFAILAVEVPRDSIETLTRRLREKIETHNTRNNTARKLSISMGVARYNPKFPCSIDDLLSEADKLMYEEKRNKKELKTNLLGTP